MPGTGTGIQNFFKNNFLLLVILITAAILRFYNLGSFSLSNDELSALVRTEYSSFSELLEEGIKIDAHPAGVQVFLFYWIKVFGISEFVLRFPFALAGIFSVLLIYLVGKKWFGKTCGLLAAAALAGLQFPLLYSQIARPYSFGLLFTLCAAWFWSLVLFEDKSKIRNAAGLCLSLAACAYTHYFSMLMAGLTGLSGLFFLKKDNFKAYLIACGGAVLIFLPHISIFFLQLGYGGIGSWLSKPTGKFFEDYFNYGFNDSEYLHYFFVVLCIAPAIYYRNFTNWKFYLLCAAWFLLPYLIGYWYSVKVNPVLQYSTLLFSYPFLILFTTGFIPEDKFPKLYRNVLVVLVLVSSVVSTTVEKKYYSRNHFGVFKELALNTIEWNKLYGRQNVTSVLNVINPKYTGYYFDKYNHHPEIKMHFVADDSSVARLLALVDSVQTEYFIYGWSNIYHPYEVVESIRKKFPVAVEQDTFFNSSISLYKRGFSHVDEIFSSAASYEQNTWGEEEMIRDSIQAHSGKYSENLEGKEFGLTFQSSETKASSGDILTFSAWFLSHGFSDCKLVISMEDEGQTPLWASADIKNFNLYPGTWQRIILSREIPKNIPSSARVKCYFWNTDKKKVFTDDLEVSIRNRSYYK